MPSFQAIIQKFGKKGEKTGWTYIDIPFDVTQKLMPGNKKSFRVKGKLDAFPINSLSLIPMGEGEFILPLNAELRKGIGKREGAMLKVTLTVDKSERILDEEFMVCLNDEPAAMAHFQSLPPSHRHYYSKWISSAKSEATKAKRIAQAITALSRKQHYGEMIRSLKGKS